MVDANDRGGFAPGKFLVVVHPDWEEQGLLLVDLDSSTRERGKPGLIRVEVEEVSRYLMVLEESNANFAALKASEVEIQWSEPYDGYTQTILHSTRYSGANDVGISGIL